MAAARVVAVAPGSPASVAGIEPGDEVLALNGELVRDVIRYHVQADEAYVELELRRGGLERRLVVEKQAGEPLGVELSAAVFDRVRTCDNHCPFCFIFQLPAGMRRSLYLKDDDYRLSFLYGNFTTLTRFTEADLERVVTEGLGPLYVSIHATDPDLRARLLRNRRGAVSLRWLAALLDAGVIVHGQIVVCPGLNDGAALDDTLLGVLDRYPALATVAVVPVGVAVHSREASLRAHTRDEAAGVLDQVAAWQARFVDALGRRVVYAADEYYVLAGAPFPDPSAYDGFAQHENGVGMARTFLADAERALAGRAGPGHGPRAGFFAWVDGAPAAGYRAPARPAPGGPSRCRRRRHRSGSSPASTAPRSSDRSSPRSPATPASPCGSCRSPTGTSAATSRSPDSSPAPTSPPRSPTSRPATATCSPTSCCPKTGSSTTAPSRTCRTPSSWSRPTGRRSSPP